MWWTMTKCFNHDRQGHYAQYSLLKRKYVEGNTTLSPKSTQHVDNEE